MRTAIPSFKRLTPQRIVIIAASLGLAAGPEHALAQRPLGIDVSSYQGSINWSSVRGAGVTFAWAKATEGVTINDAYFVSNENNGKAAGVYMGAYHFAHPNLNSPAAEANHFWAIAGGYIQADGRTLMPMLDMEVFSGVVGAGSYSDWANQWCNNMVGKAAAVGVVIKPAIYTSACSACNFNSSIAQWSSDVANYNGQNAYTGNPWSVCTGCEVWGPSAWNFWQVSSTGAVPGISGNVDLDVFNGSSAGLSAFVASSPQQHSEALRIDSFVRGENNNLYHKFYNNSGWSGWEFLDGGITSDPAACSWGTGRLDVFYRGTDNSLQHIWYAGGWGGPESLGGVLTGKPAAASWGSGRIDVFVKGTDNLLYHNLYPFNGGWWGWHAEVPGAIASDPAAVSWGVNRIDVFAKSTTNTLIHTWWDGTRWYNWENLGGTLTGAPAATSRGPGRLDVFVRGTDNALYHKWYETTGWYNWEWLGGTLTSDPGAVSDNANRAHAFVKGTDNAMWHTWFDTYGWFPFETLGGTLTGAPAACSWTHP